MSNHVPETKPGKRPAIPLSLIEAASLLNYSNEVLEMIRPTKVFFGSGVVGLAWLVLGIVLLAPPSKLIAEEPGTATTAAVIQLGINEVSRNIKDALDKQAEIQAPSIGVSFDIAKEQRKQELEKQKAQIARDLKALQDAFNQFRDSPAVANGFVLLDLSAQLSELNELNRRLNDDSPETIRLSIAQGDPGCRIEGTPPAKDLALASRLKLARARIGIPDVREAEKESKIAPAEPLVVALIDTGLDASHPNLKNALWKNAKEIPDNKKDDDGNGYVDDVHGYNFAAGNGHVQDYHGHGTYSAGILAGRPANNDYAGINPRVKLMVIRVTELTGTANDLAVSKAIRYAVSNGARILQISLCLEPRSKKVDEAVAWALEKDVMIIACANSRSRSTKDVSPASAPGVITVGACDNEGGRAPFSGWGAHVDVVAPGMEIPGLRARHTDFLTFMAGRNPMRESSGGVIDEHIYVADGSCSALPQVTGIASLIWQRHPKLSAEQIRRKLLMGCDDLEDKGWDRNTGYGRINFKNALNADPDLFLQSRVTGAKVIRRGKSQFIQVFGQADGTQFRRRIFQIALGENPKDDAWKTVGWSQTRVREVDGLLETIPLAKLNKAGRWSVRLIVHDRTGQSRESRGTINRR